jgi:tRNA uridine 5-carboxymethylaminomethyl modification enzyme
MFTSRAEFRLLLREDNADVRLSRKGHALGLLSAADFERFEEKEGQKATLEGLLRKQVVQPSESNKKRLQELGLGGLSHPTNLLDLLRRPHATISDLMTIAPNPFDLAGFRTEATRGVELNRRYAGYEDRQREQVERFKRLEKRPIPNDIDFEEVAGLSREATEKLLAIRPRTVGQASRISGMTPAAITALMIHMGRS